MRQDIGGRSGKIFSWFDLQKGIVKTAWIIKPRKTSYENRKIPIASGDWFMSSRSI